MANAIGGVPSSYLGAWIAVRLQSLTLLRIYGMALTAFGLYDLVYTEREALSRLFGAW